MWKEKQGQVEGISKNALAIENSDRKGKRRRKKIAPVNRTVPKRSPRKISSGGGVFEVEKWGWGEGTESPKNLKRAEIGGSDEGKKKGPINEGKARGKR